MPSVGRGFGWRAIRPRLIAAPTMVVALLLAIPSGRDLAAEPGARVVVSAPARDLGQVVVGSRVEHEFVIHNEGETVLVIERVAAAPELRLIAYDRSIAPGASGRVKVEVDTWAGVGPGRLWVKLATNDPTQPEVRLDVTITLRQHIIADPGYARYVLVQGEDEVSVTHTLAPTDESEFRVIGVEAPSYLYVSHRRLDAPEWKTGLRAPQWRLDSTIRASAPVGPLSGFVLVHLDHPKQKQLRIPVNGFVRPLFAVTPPSVALGEVDPAHPPRQRFLIVKNFGKDAAQLTAARTDVPGIGVEIVPLEPGRVYRLELSFSPDAPRGSVDGKIYVGTSTARVPVLEVPLTGRIVSSSAPSRDADR